MIHEVQTMSEGPLGDVIQWIGSIILAETDLSSTTTAATATTTKVEPINGCLKSKRDNLNV